MGIFHYCRRHTMTQVENIDKTFNKYIVSYRSYNFTINCVTLSETLGDLNDEVDELTLNTCTHFNEN